MRQDETSPYSWEIRTHEDDGSGGSATEDEFSLISLWHTEGSRRMGPVDSLLVLSSCVDLVT